MSKPVLTITYIIDNASMTDNEFEDQPERKLIVTASMLEKLIEDNDPNIKNSDTIDWQYCSVKLGI